MRRVQGTAPTPESAEMSRVLVTGATGRVGGEVVAGLPAAGAEVRALTRDPPAARLPAEVEVVAGDLTLPESLEAGLAGVDAVFLRRRANDRTHAAAAITAVSAGVAYFTTITPLMPLVGVPWNWQ